MIQIIRGRATSTTILQPAILGNGLVVSVGHNLIREAKYLVSMPEAYFQNRVLRHATPEDKKILLNHYILNHYILNPKTKKRYPAQTKNKAQIKAIIGCLKIDTRWQQLYQEQIADPFLFLSFSTPLFFNDSQMTTQWPEHHTFFDQRHGVHTYMLPLQLVFVSHSYDIALCKIINTPSPVVDSIPSTHLSFQKAQPDDVFYCLQASPSGSHLGRLLNTCNLESIMDHHAIKTDPFSGNDIHRGLRYILNGYFRFGSSGAPYFCLDPKTNQMALTAIHSEAASIQLSIHGDKGKNAQYTRAIATPLLHIKQEIIQYLPSVGPS